MKGKSPIIIYTLPGAILLAGIGLWIFSSERPLEAEGSDRNSRGLTEQILIDTEFVYYDDIWSISIPDGKPVAFLEDGVYQVEDNPLMRTWRIVDSTTVQIHNATCRYDLEVEVLVCPHDGSARGLSFYVVRTSDREQWIQKMPGYNYFVKQAIKSIDACLHWGGEVGDQSQGRNHEIMAKMERDCAIAKQDVNETFENRSRTALLSSKIIVLIDRGLYEVDDTKREMVCTSAESLVEKELSNLEEGYAFQSVCS